VGPRGRVGGVRRWRDRLRGWTDRIVASDPGLGRLRTAAGGVVAMGTALAVEWGFGLLIGAGGQGLVVGMLLGAVVAMMGSMALAGQQPGPALRTAVFFPVAIGIGLLGGVAVGGHADLMLWVFVLVMFLAVFVRRFGPPFFFYGFMAWMGYFFAMFLHATVAMLPMLFGAVLVATAWVLLLAVTVLRRKPARTVQQMLGAFGARARGAAGAAAALLATDPADTRRRGRLQRRLHHQRMRLAECALMIEGSLDDEDAAPEGWPAVALRRHLIDAQLATDAVVGAVETLLSTPDPDPAARDAVVRCLRALAAGDLAGAAGLAADLATDPADGPAAGATRRVAAGIADYTALARRWHERPEAGATDGYEPQVVLAMGNLAGSAAVARDVPPRGRRWNPLSRLDLVTRQAVQVAVAGGLAIVVGRLLSEQRYYWAVLAAFIAFSGTATRSETFIKAANRVLGTLVGLFASALLAELTAGDTVLVMVVILLSMFCGFYLIRISYAYMIFFLTIMLGQLYSVLGEFSTGLLVLRLEETAIGGAIGFLVALLVAPTSTRDTVRAARAASLDALGALLDELARRVDPTRPTARATDGGDPDGLLRVAEDKLRQLALVAAPLARPMVPGHDHRRTRFALRLHADAAVDARALTSLVRQVQAPPAAFATATAALATAARALAEPAAERPRAAAAAALDDANAALFETARPVADRTEVVATPLVHLQRLLGELLEGSLGSDRALGSASTRAPGSDGAAARPVITGIVTGVGASSGSGSVTLIDMHGRGAGTTHWDRDGGYRLTAPAGSYTLLVTAPGRGPVARRLTVGRGIRRADVHLDPKQLVDAG
jgi:uncharacterized membrane protein YccC